MKKSIEELSNMLTTCNEVQVGQTWRHYKGGYYKVVDKVIDCNTNEILITYDYTDYDDYSFTTIRFCRPLSEWLSQTEDGLPRFSRVKKFELYLTDEEYKNIKSGSN